VLIELFSLCVTAEALRAKIYRESAISLQRGQLDPKFQKTRLSVLSYGIKIWADFSSGFSQFTRLTDRWTHRWTDGRTDRIVIARPRRSAFHGAR